MEYWCKCPEPGDKEGWRQWTKCSAIAAAIVSVVFGVIYFFLR